jgi:integrase/recombinase XerD
VIAGFVGMHTSPRTRRMYASDLKDLASFVEAQVRGPIETLQEEQAIEWRQHLESRRLAPATIARKLAVARGFFGYLLDLDVPPAGLAQRNPFRRVRPPRYDRSIGKTPSPGPEEVSRLLRRIGSHSRRGRRDLLIYLLLFNQGLRVSEVAHLKRTNVLSSGKLTYLALVGKGGSEVRSVLQESVARLLKSHVESLPPNKSFLFSRIHPAMAAEDRPLSVRSIHARLKTYATRAGLDPDSIRPHSGRVYFITQSYLRTRDLERVARAVGHRELATTRRYLRLGTALEDHPAVLLDLLGSKRRKGCRSLRGS